MHARPVYNAGCNYNTNSKHPQKCKSSVEMTVVCVCMIDQAIAPTDRMALNTMEHPPNPSVTQGLLTIVCHSVPGKRHAPCVVSKHTACLRITSVWPGLACIWAYFPWLNDQSQMVLLLLTPIGNVCSGTMLAFVFQQHQMHHTSVTKSNSAWFTAGSSPVLVCRSLVGPHWVAQP